MAWQTEMYFVGTSFFSRLHTFAVSRAIFQRDFQDTGSEDKCARLEQLVASAPRNDLNGGLLALLSLTVSSRRDQDYFRIIFAAQRTIVRMALAISRSEDHAAGVRVGAMV